MCRVPFSDGTYVGFAEGLETFGHLGQAMKMLPSLSLLPRMCSWIVTLLVKGVRLPNFSGEGLRPLQHSHNPAPQLSNVKLPNKTPSPSPFP